MRERAFDSIAALLLLFVLAPLFIAIYCCVWATLGRPVFFRQSRIGLGGRAFLLLKFRTMTLAHDGKGRLLPDAERLAPFGKLLRSTSLDELPELWNVLRGDMRLVGPRPLLPVYVPRYTPEQFRRHEVKPGITGWAQVNGRNALSWEERFAHDIWYVDNRSVWLDLKILMLTVKQVVGRRGINQPGYATAQEFMGSPFHADGPADSGR